MASCCNRRTRQKQLSEMKLETSSLLLGFDPTDVHFQMGVGFFLHAWADLSRVSDELWWTIEQVGDFDQSEQEYQSQAEHYPVLGISLSQDLATFQG